MGMYLQARGRGSEQTNPARTLLLDFRPPGLCKDKSLLFKAPQSVILVTAAPANEFILSLSCVLLYLVGQKMIKLKREQGPRGELVADLSPERI